MFQEFYFNFPHFIKKKIQQHFQQIAVISAISVYQH